FYDVRVPHSFPTRRSSDLFQVKPKFLRLIFVVADTATRVPRQGSFVGGVGPSTEKSTLRVTPRIVKSPSTASSPSRTRRMPVDRSEEHTSELQSPDHIVCR